MKLLEHDGQGRAREVDVPIGARGLTTVDFGAAGKSDASVVITGQTSLTAQSMVVARVVGIATPNHSADEHMVEEIDVTPTAIVPGVGFTLVARTRNVALRGAWTVGWMWS